MHDNQKHLVIIGGGITGLAAAFYLEKEVEEKGLPIQISLIEASPRLGGKIQTLYKDGYIIERGPDSFLERRSVDRDWRRMWVSQISSSIMKQGRHMY